MSSLFGYVYLAEIPKAEEKEQFYRGKKLYLNNFLASFIFDAQWPRMSIYENPVYSCFVFHFFDNKAWCIKLRLTTLTPYEKH
jgi:hypothetical protein